jgi:hypothetical protein
MEDKGLKGCLFLVFFIPFVYLLIIISSPFIKENDPELYKPAQESLISQCNAEIPQLSEIRIELRWNANVRVYLKRHEFENIPYPDRDAVMERIGKAWFGKDPSMGNVVFSSVSIHDIRTGQKLASYRVWFLDTRPPIKQTH